MKTTDHDQVPPPLAQRWWQRLEARWNRIQVGRQGSYSVERLESFDHYCKTTSQIRVLLVCILTPLPALLTAVLLECLPLRPPSESWTANFVFWIRLGLANFAMCLTGSYELMVLVPELNYTLLKRLVVCGGVIAAYVASFLLGADVVGFPFPLTWYVGGFLVAHYMPMMMLLVFGPKPFKKSSPCRPNLFRFSRYFQAIMLLVNIYPVYKVLYGFVPVEYRAIVIVVLPVWRLAAKQFMVRATREMEDFIPEIAAMTVDFFSTLFVSGCMSTTGPMYLSILFIAADLIQSLLEYREVRMNANTVFDLLQDLKKKSSRAGSLLKKSQTPSLAACVLAVTRDPAAYHISSLESVRLTACYPHPLSREQSDKLQGLQSSLIYGYSSPLLRLAPPRRVHIQSARIAPTTGPSPVFDTNPSFVGSGDIAKKLVQQGLQLMFHCEYLILVEYVECIVPVMYVAYKMVLEHLSNVVYYPGGAGQFGSAAVESILVFAGLEISSLLLLHVFLQRKFAFSPLYQLAFVLETQFYMGQAQIFVESIFLLQYELEH